MPNNTPITQKVKGPGGPGKTTYVAKTTAPAITMTAKKKVTSTTAIAKPKPSSYVYIIGEMGKQNREVTKAQYEKHTGPKISMKKDDPRLKTLGTQGGKPTMVPGGYKKKP